MDIPELLHRVARRQDCVVTRGQALVCGLTADEVDRRSRSGRWRTIHGGSYLIEPAEGPVPRRADIRAAVLSLGPGAVAVLGTAAELHGIAGLPASDLIHVSVPGPPATPAADQVRVRVHHLGLARDDVHVVAGIPTASPARTAADLLLRFHRYAAVAMLDSALHRGLLTTEGLGRVSALIDGAGAPCGYLAEADGRAQSPLETRVRLRCVDGGVGPDDLQHLVRDVDGHILGAGDLAWPRDRMLAEADGATPHGTPDAVFADRHRQNRLAHAGWRVLRFTWADTCRADYIPHVVRSALSCDTTALR